jgi:hypothetical protein
MIFGCLLHNEMYNYKPEICEGKGAGREAICLRGCSNIIVAVEENTQEIC